MPISKVTSRYIYLHEPSTAKTHKVASSTSSYYVLSTASASRVDSSAKLHGHLLDNGFEMPSTTSACSSSASRDAN